MYNPLTLIAEKAWKEKEMKRTNKTATHPEKAIVNATPNSENAFTALVNQFETAYIAGDINNNALTELSTAIAFSVLKKCIDPQRKTAVERKTISDNGMNQTLIELKRDIAKDIKTLNNFYFASNNAIKAGYNKKGEYVQVVLDESLKKALDIICGKTTGDGIELVNTAVVPRSEIGKSCLTVGFFPRERWMVRITIRRDVCGCFAIC